ncbi:MAG: hypothetical protein WAN43_14550, partial [Rhodomicrobium sp.]
MSESEILVNGYKVARGNHKPDPEVEEANFATAPAPARRAEISKQMQCDRRNRRRLTRPQGAFEYINNNDGKDAK